MLVAFLCSAAALADDRPPAASEVPYQSSEPEQPASALKPGANSFSEGQARKLLLKQGYADVSPLMNGPDGIWRGTAIKDQRQVAVSVDFQGHVQQR